MDSSVLKEQVRRQFTEYMEANGLRKTQERYAILDFVYSLNGHFDIEQVALRLAGELCFHVSVPTIYKTLVLLEEAGLVVKHLYHAGVMYERTLGLSPHSHLICMVCGKMKEQRIPALDKQLRSMKLPRFRMSSYSLVVYGTCVNCTAGVTRRKKKVKTKDITV